MSRLQSLRGMVDLLPEQTARWQAVETVVRKHFAAAAVKEIRTPLIEMTELFARGIGEETDVVGKEMYTFQDRSSRSCTLRPEGTASVVRSVLENGLLAQGPQRLWYAGPMFRYERPQAGRQRQFHQVGVEFLGFSSPRSDAELILLAWDLLCDLGLSDLEVQINSLGNSNDRELYRRELVAWLQRHEQYLDPDSQRRLSTNPLRVLDSKDANTQALLADAPMLLDMLCQDSSLRFSQVKSILESLSIPFKVNPKLVRGLDYYDHTAFEFVSDRLGAQATICGGGRYDRLVEELGGQSAPAIGFAFGMERLMLVMESVSLTEPFGRASKLLESVPPFAYIVNRGELAMTQALLLARRLWVEDLTVELDDSGSAFSKQFKRADRSGAQYAVVIGDDEISRGVVLVKSLRESSPLGANQSVEIPFSECAELLVGLRG